MTTVAERWHAARAAVDAACAAAARDPATVSIIAVSKGHPASAIDEVAAAGATDAGESYVQELLAKQAEVRAPVRWHHVGRLQRNKARMVAGQVALVHAVDSLDLAAELGRRALARGAVQPILLAINLAGEAQKTGVAAAEAATLLAGVGTIEGVRVDGLMTLPPAVDDPEQARPWFRALRELRDRLATPTRPLPQLSMGMSDDFAVAIAEGATLVRIGTAIFGARAVTPPG